jgi:hypothetical protein
MFVCLTGVSCTLPPPAQVGTNYYQQWEFIRDFSDRPMHTAEAVLGAAAKDALDVAAGLVVVVSRSGRAARLVAKYRPCVPVLVITDRSVWGSTSDGVGHTVRDLPFMHLAPGDNLHAGGKRGSVFPSPLAAGMLPHLLPSRDSCNRHMFAAHNASLPSLTDHYVATAAQ